MPSFDETTSSPLGKSPSKENALEYYKSQYEQLEAELADFQASSRELEAELEKDVEASEKRERQLQEKVEGLGFEVDEWKAKYKQSKAEANTAQNTLQKEITTLRDTNRTTQLKLRDIEVANDDFERQARNTTSSLEDLESKYNVAIERDVMLEEEIKAGEQEREFLRIETQRLRDELSDLKVEAEIMQGKLRHAEAAIERQRLQRPTLLNTGPPRPQSAISQHSPTTTASSPTVATPPTKSTSSTVSDTPTPPSPPVSERSLSAVGTILAPSLSKSRLSVTDSNTTNRLGPYSSRPMRHSRGPSLSIINGRSTPSATRRTTLNRPESRQELLANTDFPSSTSLTQIRGLIGKMQKLEQRVQSARSKLPAPASTPPRASPRPASALGRPLFPATITMRSQRKRTAGSNANTITPSRTEETFVSETDPRITQRTSRLSYSGRPPTPSGDTAPVRDHGSRPSSRASLSSRSSVSYLPNSLQSLSIDSSRPSSRHSSRQSMSGTRTPLGHFALSTSATESRIRPRSSMSGSYASSHGFSHTVNASFSNYSMDESAEAEDTLTPTPSRRTTLGVEGSAIPTPSGLIRRQSGTGPATAGRRTSIGVGLGEMGPPTDRRGVTKLRGMEETF